MTRTVHRRPRRGDELVQCVCVVCQTPFLIERKRLRCNKCDNCRKAQWDGKYGRFTDHLSPQEIEDTIQRELLKTRQRSREENWMEQMVLVDGSWVFRL